MSDTVILKTYNVKEYPMSILVMNEDTKNAFYELLRKFTSRLRHASIPYFAVAGTLIGIERHQDFIPWDDDVDLGVVKDHEETLKLVLKSLDNTNDELTYVTSWFGYHVYPRHGEQNPNGGMARYPYLDIFIYRKIPLNSYVLDRPEARDEWSKDFFYGNELFPLIDRKFGPLHLPSPKYPKGYLDRQYGSDWSTYGYLPAHTHKGVELDKRYKIDISLVEAANE
jgi:hypothetical protein